MNNEQLVRIPAVKLDSIPTISAAISSCNIDAVQDGAEALDLDGVAAPASVNIHNIIQQKFKDNERLLAFFEGYQLVGQEHSIRLLALVESVVGGTYAVFSLSVVRMPPRNPADLSIDKIFAVNENFKIGMDKKGSISQLQFELSTGDERPAKFFHFPIITCEGALDFDQFQDKLLCAKLSMPQASLATDNILTYSWLNDYREIGEVKHELKRREHEYIFYKDFKIYCATWNVNNKYYTDCPLNLWLSACEDPPDIYAIAFQELGMSGMTIAISENRPDPIWVKKLLESVHPEGEYEELATVRLVGMMLTVIIRKQLRPFIARCRVKTIARGVFNTLGNKGGVAVSMQLNEGNICFVNSHLAAHTAYVAARNDDYAGIIRNLVFDDDLRRTINDHDHIFWIGDLNYRIEEPPGLQLPTNRGAENSYQILLKFDQLKQEMLKGNCFKGFTEGAINFRPTYKYDVGTDNFDSSEKQRAPAYCDRILWKGVRIEQLVYNSVMELRQSDHKPVYAIFIVKVKTKDEKRYKRVHEEVLKLVDKRENENQPQIMVDKSVIDFGLVSFNEKAWRDFKVSNNCALNVDFSFKVKDPPLNDICEKWLKVNPKADSLWIDTSKNINVTLHINKDSIRGLLKKIRTTNWKFDFDILILHVNNGPDMFITVAGEYKPSCYGLSMETLCRTDRPVADYTQAQIKDLMNDESPDFRVTMPREFFLLIDFLHKQGEKVVGCFTSMDYKYAHYNEVREWLDSWSSNEFPSTPQVAAEALLMLLDLPEEPLLHPFVEDLLRTNSTAEAMELISMLSSPKRNVFVHLCMFLREGIEKQFYNLQQVAMIFGRVLLRDDKCREGWDLRRREFMHRFICSDMGTLSNNAPPVAGDNNTAAPSKALDLL